MIEFLMSPSGGESSGMQGWTSIAFFGLFFLVLYFFMIRPQSKKAKDQKLFVTELKAGDKIVTISGVHGKIVKAEDDTYLVEIDTNTKIRIERSAVSMEYTKAMLNRKQAS
ncbi:MAG: preprotein translocase subunit YajC [Fimbriimonadaceae bacterium]|nr:preprotein translocase subunit YajC [Chitinophagales bacterium]